MRLQKLFITTLLSVSVIGTAIPANVSAASYATTKRTYTLKVAGKKQKKKARGAIYNGKTIKTKAPGFLRGDTTMYSASYVFQKGLGVSYSYSSKTWKITLKKGSKTITMKRGSKYAYVNGKKKKLPTPARRVYSYNRKKITSMFLVSSVQNILDILIHGAVVLMLVLSQQVTVIRHLLPLQRFQQQMENIMYNLINQRAYPRATSQQLTITITIV